MTRARDVANLIGSGNYSSTTFTATAGQTAFTIAHTQGFVQVFMNGLLLDETADYTSNGTAITLTSGAAAGDEIEVVKYNTFSVGDAIPASGGTFTGSIDASAGLTTPAGHVIQVKTHSFIGGLATSSNSFTSISAATFSFTPKLATSKLYITANYAFQVAESPSGGNVGFSIRTFHDGTTLFNGVTGGYNFYSSVGTTYYGMQTNNFDLVDASSTNARNITADARIYDSSNSLYVGYNGGTAESVITVMEIAQ
jgi:hypothetical protein